MKQCVEKQVGKSRFKHTLGVMEIARQLAIIHGEDAHKAAVAALLHDIAKEFSPVKARMFCEQYQIPLDDYLERNIHLVHGNIGACIAREQCDIHDEDVLNAIANHTLGQRNMSTLEKIIYLADIIEPNRRPHVGLEELRKLAYINLNDAMRVALYSNIAYLNAKNKEVHPIIYSILEEYENTAHMEGRNERTGKV